MSARSSESRGTWNGERSPAVASAHPSTGTELPGGGVPAVPMRRDQGWCENPASGRYNRPVRLPARDCTDRMRRDDALYDLVFVLDHNFTRRCKGRGSAIFFHLARPGLTPTAGCVAISAADMRKLAPRLARGAEMWIG